MTAELTLHVDGMTCGNCRARVERALNALEGVAGADVNLATERARIVYLPEILGPPAIAEAIRGAGYVPSEAAGEDPRAANEDEIASLKRRFVVAARFTIPLFLIAMGSMLPGIGLPSIAGGQAWLWAQLVLAAPVVLWSGRGFFVHGWAELRHASPGMNSLVMIGAGAAFGYSVLALLAPSIFPEGTAVPYFEAAGVIVTLILLGCLLEAIARGRASDAIAALMDLRPATARVLYDGDAERASAGGRLGGCAGGNLPSVESFSVEPGLGIAARVAEREVVVGSARFLEGRSVDCSASERVRAELSGDGKTAVLAAIDGEPAAILAFRDPPKEESRQAISDLMAQGFDIATITGDSRATAEAVAQSLGIARVEAEVLPDRKAEAVKALRRKDRTVAFVGDEINDAPALAEADTGIAIGTGTDIAMETADVVLMSGDLRGVVTAIRLARRTLATIRVNLFWAYAYNVALIPLAAGALYPVFGILLDPMLAAAAMSASSVLVVANSLRLRRFA